MLHKSFTGWDGAGVVAMLERALRGRDDVFFVLLERSARTAAEAAERLHQLLRDFPDRAQELTQEIQDLEHVGDDLTHQIIRGLDREIATPIDRADILELAGALDDITDFIEESAASLLLYRTEASMLEADAMAQVLVEATREVAVAVQKACRFERISSHTVEVHRLENEGDRLVRRAIASLFIDGIDPLVVLRWKDIFEQIEEAIDSTERAAFVLESIVIKNI